MVKKLFALSSFCLTISLPNAHASALTTDSVVLAVSTNASDFLGTEVADTGVLPFVSSTSLSGTVEQRVYMESSGTLDFYYLISNSAASLGSIGHMTTTNFTGFSTGVSFLTIPIGGIPPSGASRSIAGDTVEFDFQGLNGDTLTPGASCAWLEISTNATLFALVGTTSVIDSTSATVTTYSPVTMLSQAPEPMTVALLSSGLAAIALLGARRRSLRT